MSRLAIKTRRPYLLQVQRPVTVRKVVLDWYLDKNGNAEPDTGGRNDAFFYVHSEDIGGFAIKRLQMGIRWWEDVIKYNDNSHLYTQEFLDTYPPTW